MKKVLATIVLLSFMTTACTGSFNLTKKVYNFHRSQSDKWADELCFLLVALTPIYGLATFADAIVFNSIEFWSGDNPVALNNDKPFRMVKQGKDEVLVAYLPKSDQILVAPKTGATNEKLVFEKNDQMVLAKNTKGDVLFSSMKNEAGDVTVYDAKGVLVQTYSADQVAQLKEQLMRK